MQKFSAAFKVGFVVLLGIVATIVMILKFSKDWGQKEGLIHLHAYFNDATGLTLKSQVRIAGIQVGEVESIALEGNRAKVVFSVREDIQLHAGSMLGDNPQNSATVTKKLSGILGDYVLDLTNGIEGAILTDGDAIPYVIQDSGISSIMSNAETIMDDVKQITSSLSEALNGKNGDSQISQMLTNLNETMKNVREVSDINTDKINAIMENLERLSHDTADMVSDSSKAVPQLINELHDTLADLRSLIQTTSSNMDNVFSSADGPLQQISSSLDKLDRSLANIERVTEKINNGEGSIGKLLSDESMADEAEGLLKDTRQLIASGTKTVEAANELIKPISDLAVDVSLRGDYLVNANAMKVDFGVKLQSREDTMYLLDLIMDPKGTSSTKSTLTYSSSEGPVYETVTTNDDSFKFSLQYAKRWRWFVGRFGLIENTGGLGGDVLLFDDDLQFKFDLFAFNENEYPRVRGLGLLYFSLFLPWEWSKTFYVSAGFDDPLNKDEFDYFFGIGFRFNDNDIKSMMSMLPSIK